MLVLGGSTGLYRTHIHRSQLVHPFPYIAIHYVMAMKLTLTWPLKCAPSPQNQGLGLCTLIEIARKLCWSFRSEVISFLYIFVGSVWHPPLPITPHHIPISHCPPTEWSTALRLVHSHLPMRSVSNQADEAGYQWIIQVNRQWNYPRIIGRKKDDES